MFQKRNSIPLRIDKKIWQPQGSEEAFAVTFRRSRLSRNVRILISTEGRVTVTGPLRVSQRFMEGVLQSKRRWVVEELQKIQQRGDFRKDEDVQAEYQQYKEAARKRVAEKLEYWNQFYGFTYGRVSIRNQRTRWGSCSARGNLSFHYRIALLPEPLADYLIVHELCHLKAFDHSPRFWALVAQTIPDYQKRRQLLRKNAL